MSKHSIVILLLLLTFYVNGQNTYLEKDFQKQIELQHDNDFLVLTDRYYTSGLFLSYRYQLKNGIIKKGNEQLELKLVQEIFTPFEIQSTNIKEFDRSYAGFLGFGTTWSSASKNHLISIGSVIGIVGPNSGAGGFQRWYHNTLVVSDPPIWQSELKDSFHVNLYSFYVREWELAPNPFGVRFALKPSVAIGSRDIYFEPEAILYFGRKNKISNSIAFNQLGSNKREVYFSFRFAYRSVFYNGLIEGNLFGDNSLVLRETENSLLRMGFDFHNRNNHNNYKFGIRYNSSEAVNSQVHKFIILSYAYSF